MRFSDIVVKQILYRRIQILRIFDFTFGFTIVSSKLCSVQFNHSVVSDSL